MYKWEYANILLHTLSTFFLIISTTRGSVSSCKKHILFLTANVMKLNIVTQGNMLSTEDSCL